MLLKIISIFITGNLFENQSVIYQYQSLCLSSIQWLIPLRSFSMREKRLYNGGRCKRWCDWNSHKETETWQRWWWLWYQTRMYFKQQLCHRQTGIEWRCAIDIKRYSVIKFIMLSLVTLFKLKMKVECKQNIIFFDLFQTMDLMLKISCPWVLNR